MRKSSITEKQKQTYFYIKEKLDNIGYLPTVTDMARDLNISRQRLHILIDRLIIKGYLTTTEVPGRRYVPTDKIIV